MTRIDQAARGTLTTPRDHVSAARQRQNMPALINLVCTPTQKRTRMSAKYLSLGNASPTRSCFRFVFLIEMASNMKTLVLIVAVASGIAFADDSKTTYQTLPGSSIRDYSAPTYVTEGNTTYQPLLGSSTRDYRAPNYVTNGNTTYQTLPGTSIRNYSAPSYVSRQSKK